MFTDTHCHIHWSDYPIEGQEVVERAQKAGVDKMICVGTDINDSISALEYSAKFDGVFASVGVHPHYAEGGIGNLEEVVKSALANDAKNGRRKLVAIGEVGLDYYRNQSSPEAQKKILFQQIEIAQKYNLPLIFHVRDAYDDFWQIFDSFSGLRGVLHCFTDSEENLAKGLERGLYFGINGISTFSKDQVQQAMFANIPLHKTLLETDAPLLTPSPFRGKVKVNEPAFVREIAKYCGGSRHIDVEQVASTTTANACALFNL
jgi:TatD DNase family protein